jgi:hypothetical protein
MPFFQLDRKNKDPEELLMLELLGNGGKVFALALLNFVLKNKGKLELRTFNLRKGPFYFYEKVHFISMKYLTGSHNSLKYNSPLNHYSTQYHSDEG